MRSLMILCTLLALVVSSCTFAVPPTPTAEPTSPPATPDLAATEAALRAKVIAQATADMAATLTAMPTNTPTATNTSTPKPTNTPRPPTDTPAPPTDTPRPTNTRGPSPTPRPTNPPPSPTPGAITAVWNVKGYEQWGRPVFGCAAFDNGNPVRKFNVEVIVTNNSAQDIEDWEFVSYNNTGGQAIITCYYFYGAILPIHPGESKSVTFAAFLERDQYVSRMRMEFGPQNVVIQRCFSPEGAIAGC